ncbi:MAG: hypothetical protein MHMPM18_002333 [Marteilia pararefringens]
MTMVGGGGADSQDLALKRMRVAEYYTNLVKTKTKYEKVQSMQTTLSLSALVMMLFKYSMPLIVKKYNMVSNPILHIILNHPIITKFAKSNSILALHLIWNPILKYLLKKRAMKKFYNASIASYIHQMVCFTVGCIEFYQFANMLLAKPIRLSPADDVIISAQFPVNSTFILHCLPHALEYIIIFLLSLRSLLVSLTIVDIYSKSPIKPGSNAGKGVSPSNTQAKSS